MSFFEELKRRNVIKVAVAYIVVGWLTAQVAEFATENFGAPEWVLKVFVVFLILGLPLVLIFAWAFEMTPEGLKRETEIDRSESITHKTGRKLDFTIIGVLVLVAGYFIYESRFTGGEPDSVSAQPTSVQTQNAEVATTSDNSIAVLPFANRSLQEEDQFFTDGIHDDLLTQLAKISNLKVISRTSMMQYKDTKLPIPEIARELGVSTILEGGVQRAGKRIRINAQLIDVTNDQHLWAETFDREMTMENIFDIQSEITRQIVSAVRGELTEAEAEAINQLPTSNLQAYEAHMKARAFTNHANYAKENFVNAQPWAEMAVELDPEFAQAWSSLALIHGQAIWIGYDTSPQRHQAMKEAVEMARTLAPDQPWSLLAQAEYFYRIDRDFSSSLTVLQRAHEALPGDADILERIALSQRRLGLWEESVNSTLLAVALDPGNISSARLAIETLANMQEWSRVISLGTEWTRKFNSTDIDVELANAFAASSGDLGRSRRLLDHITPVASESYANFATYLPLLERDYQAVIDAWDQPEVDAITEQSGWFGWREIFRGFAFLELGDPEKAQAQYEQGLRMLADINPSKNSNYPYDLEALARIHVLLGENEKALEASNKAKEISPESRDVLDGTSISALHAQILGLTGHREEALAEIERLIDEPNGLVRWHLYLDPMWDFFRDDERFNELIKPHNLNEAQK